MKERIREIIRNSCAKHEVSSEHVEKAVEAGAPLFTTSGPEAPVFPLTNSFATIGQFVLAFKEAHPPIIVTEKDKVIVELNKYAVAGDMNNFRKARAKYSAL